MSAFRVVLKPGPALYAWHFQKPGDCPLEMKNPPWYATAPDTQGCVFCGCPQAQHGFLADRDQTRVCPGDWVVSRHPSIPLRDHGVDAEVMDEDTFEARFERVGETG